MKWMCVWWWLFCSNGRMNWISCEMAFCVSSQWVLKVCVRCVCMHDTWWLSLMLLTCQMCVWWYVCDILRLGVFVLISLKCLWFRMWQCVSGSLCLSACVCRGNVPAFTLCQRKGSFWLQWGSHQETPRRQPRPCSQVRTVTLHAVSERFLCFCFCLRRVLPLISFRLSF